MSLIEIFTDPVIDVKNSAGNSKLIDISYYFHLILKIPMKLIENKYYHALLDTF